MPPKAPWPDGSTAEFHRASVINYFQFHLWFTNILWRLKKCLIILINHHCLSAQNRVKISSAADSNPFPKIWAISSGKVRVMPPFLAQTGFVLDKFLPDGSQYWMNTADHYKRDTRYTQIKEFKREFKNTSEVQENVANLVSGTANDLN